MTTIFLIGKIILGVYFIMMGMNHFMKKRMMVQYARMNKLPMPDLSVMLAGIAMIFGGVMVIAWMTWGTMLLQVGLITLIVFLVLASLMMHAFWNMNADKKMENMRYFMSNMSLAGALLIILSMIM